MTPEERQQLENKRRELIRQLRTINRQLREADSVAKVKRIINRDAPALFVAARSVAPRRG
jgi:hypothetical protein